MDRSERDALFESLDVQIMESQRVSLYARSLKLPPAPPLRQPVVTASRALQQQAIRVLAGEFVDRRSGYGRRSSDHA